jgi:TrmH family RNA methyltransferase
VAASEEALILVAEGIEKPGNLGAMLRTADAVGANALISVDGIVDVFNPNVLRTSTGAVFSVPVAEFSMDELSTWLIEHSVRMVAAQPEATESIWQTDLTGKVAIAIGAEAAGLTLDLLALADTVTSIPMEGESDSLNASVAMAVIAFEAKRQHSEST